MSIGEFLANTLSADAAVREEATRRLDEMSRQNLGTYLHMLCQEFANESASTHIRKSAGLAIKNALSAREQHRKDEYAARWLQLPTEIRTAVKNIVCQTLHSMDAQTAKTAGQVIAAIAEIELARGEWNDLIRILLENVQNGSPQLRQSTLEAIGYVCEGIEPDVLVSQSDSILTAIVSGARKEEANVAVRKAAMGALLNSLVFVQKNFENEGERNYIMQVVCEATQSDDLEVKVLAFECLVKIMQLYYDKMALYMQKALYGLTIIGMKDSNERVALQAIEFWSTVCDVEFDIAWENQEDAEAGLQPSRFSHGFARGAVSEIIPVLLWLLTKKEDEEDEDEWTVSMAAATCLSLFAQSVGDAVVMPVIGFVESQIKNEDWRFREAAVMAFGSVLDGPEPNLLTPLATTALPVLIQMMQDPVPSVKDTTAWTLGRICLNLAGAIKPDVHLAPLVDAVCSGLAGSRRVASSCAWCLMNLAENLGADKDAPTGTLSPYFDKIVTSLMAAADRPDFDVHVRAAVYEAVNGFVEASAADNFPTIEKLMGACLERLNRAPQLLNEAVGMDDKVHIHETQANLCSVLAAIIRRMGAQILPVSDQIMTALLQTIQTASKTSTVLEDAFLTIGAMCAALEENFHPYVAPFLPFLYEAVQRSEEHQTCCIAIGIVGDLCRALNEKMLPYCNDLMQILGNVLTNPALHRTVKPTIISCFGDIALAVGPAMAPWVEPVMQALFTQASAKIPTHTVEAREYVNALRESIIEALVGIVQGFKGTEQTQVLRPWCNYIFQFLQTVHQENDTKTDEIMRGLYGLLGDMAETFPNGDLKTFFTQPWIEQSLREAKTDRSTSQTTREMARWCRELIKRQIAATA